MPVTLTPVAPSDITTEDIRDFLADYTEDNILIDGVEYTDQEIERAIKFTVAKYNAFTPITAATKDDINIWILLTGATSYLLRRTAHLQARNQATYQDGDVAPIGVHDKAALYASLSRELQADFDKQAQQVKIQCNLESAYGSVGSGYKNVSRFHHS